MSFPTVIIPVENKNGQYSIFFLETKISKFYDEILLLLSHKCKDVLFLQLRNR